MKIHTFSIFLLLCILNLNIGCHGVGGESIGAPMEKREQDALYSSIQGFVGTWWNGSDLYPDPCGWTPIQGVTCDLLEGFWYVTGLNIGPVHDNSLSCGPKVEFRPELFTLTHLKSLSFFNCFLSSIHHPVTIPTNNWELLSNTLESLEFRSNPGLNGQVPTSFGGLIKLQYLVLIQNGFTGEIPTSIGSLMNLKRLVLAENRVIGKIPESLGGLRQLLILDLSRNSLSGSLPMSFGGLDSLLKLDLSNNELEGKIPQEIGNLKNLTLLDLSNNKFTGELPKSLQEMSSLEGLVLSNNSIDGDLMSFQWNSLKNLMVLDLSNMNLSGGIPESISELNGLRYLGLNDNNLEGEISTKLEALPNISAIYLNGNNLTGNLKFSENFYRKMGRRFGAWNNNINLCYHPMDLMSSSYAVPYGVKPCQKKEDVTLLYNKVDHIEEEKKHSHLGNDYISSSMASSSSLGVSRFGRGNEVLVLVLVLNFLYIKRFSW